MTIVGLVAAICFLYCATLKTHSVVLSRMCGFVSSTPPMWQYSVLMDYLDVTDLLILNNDLDRNRHGHRIAFGLSKITHVKKMIAAQNLF